MSLFRLIKDGSEYNALIPKSKCEKVNFGKGDTYFSVKKIIAQVLQHNHQLKLVASVLKKNSLKETCLANHQFAYWNFQYKADAEAQLLRSPACAWKQRNDGIDCKSYTIIVSSLLLQQGIKHYIRKIKQPNYEPTLFTHVYVVVPINQKNANLNDGYYVIDGTIDTMYEPYFIDKNDSFMNLPHYGLNGLLGSEVVTETPDTGTTDTGGQGEDSSSFFSDWDWSFLKDLNWFNGPIDCWGGSAFSGEVVNQGKEKMAAVFNGILNEINASVKANDMAKFSQLEYTFRGYLAICLRAYYQKLSEGWNSCTSKSIRDMIALVESYRKNVEIPFAEWKKYYFDTQETGKTAWFDNGNTENIGFVFTYTDPKVNYQSPIRTFTPKPLTEPIKAFEWSPYLETTATAGTPFNIKDYLNSISTVLVGVKDVISDNDTPTGGEGTYENQNPPPPPIQKAGFGLVGTVIGSLLMLGFLSKMGGSKESEKTGVATKRQPIAKRKTTKK